MSAGKGRTGLSVDMFKEPSGGSVEEVSKREDDRRTPPDLELDPRGTLETVCSFLRYRRGAPLGYLVGLLQRRETAGDLSQDIMQEWGRVGNR